MEFNGFLLRDGRPGERQRKIIQRLQSREILSTRYVDDNCLYALGIYHSVFNLLDFLGLHNIFINQEPTYERLTTEFLSSLIYTVSPNTASTVGTVIFRLFGIEYEFSTDDLAGLLGIPHREGAICEAPLDAEWSAEVFTFWQRLSSSSINSFEGILASTIHNPAIRVFRLLLACTIFGRESPNKVNARELLFLQGCLTRTHINPVPFMLAHMTLFTNKTGPIVFGGLVTSIARALGLNDEIATLEPLPPRTINLKFLKEMKLCRARREGGYELMVHGVAIPSVALPCSRRTDVRDERNWTYDLNAPRVLGPLPPNIPDGEAHDTDDEYDRREQSPIPHMSPHRPSQSHTAPSSSNPVAGTAPGFHVTEEMWRDMTAREERRDGLLSTISQQLTDNMSFMQQSRLVSDRAYSNVCRTLNDISLEQNRQREFNSQHYQLVEATQGSILGNLREVRSAQAALSARLDRRDQHRSRSRRSRPSHQDGEGTSAPPQ